MITDIVVTNVRGLTREVRLQQKTLMVGPNGSGKTTMSAAVYLATLGYLPGADKKGVFANASADCMQAGIKIDGKTTIFREWTQGKSLSERISINGVTAQKNSADAMIQMAIGKDPIIVDTALFFTSTPSEKRRMVLSMVADDATLKTVTDNEQNARDAKNARTRDRQVAEKSVENLTKSLSAMPEAAAGSLEQLTKKLADTETARNEARDKVSRGEANEAAKRQIETASKTIPELEKKIADAQEGIKAAKEAVSLLLTQSKELGTVEDVQEGVTLPEEVQTVIKETIMWLKDFKDNSIQIEGIEEIIGKLSNLLPNPERQKRNQAIFNEWDSKKKAIDVTIYEAQKLGRQHEKNLADAKGRLAEVKKSDRKIEKIGEGVDQKDRAALTGLQTQMAELKRQIDPLSQRATIAKEIEKARLIANKAAEAEEDAKNVLQVAILAQQEIITKAAEMLAERSKTILPNGQLSISDDGKDFTVAWKRGGLVVERHVLSGGEKAVFDASVGFALAPTGLVVIEAAEVDDENLAEVLQHLNTSTCQQLVLTCHEPAVTPNWSVIKFEEA